VKPYAVKRLAAPSERFCRSANARSEDRPADRSALLDGTGGEWRPDDADADDVRTCYGSEKTPGIVFLRERFKNRDEAVGVIAHEFGHACTTFDDL